MTSINLVESKASLTMLGALLIISAVHLTNSMEELHMSRSKLGMILFGAGWFVVALATGMDNFHSMDLNIKLILSFLSAMAIVFSVFIMKTAKNKFEFNAPIIFAIGWILLGVVSGLGKPLVNKLFGILSPILVLIAMMVILPKSRKLNIVDNPGYSLFFMGWLALTLANSYI